MPKHVVATDHAPRAIGPYSQAIVANGLVFCSGQIALDPKSQQIVGAGDVRVQAEQVMQNLKAVIDAAGSSMDRVVRCTIYLTDLSDFAGVNEIYGWFFPNESPARATVQVAGLPKGALVEIDAIATIV